MPQNRPLSPTGEINPDLASFLSRAASEPGLQQSGLPFAGMAAKALGPLNALAAALGGQRWAEKPEGLTSGPLESLGGAPGQNAAVWMASNKIPSWLRQFLSEVPESQLVSKILKEWDTLGSGFYRAAFGKDNVVAKIPRKMPSGSTNQSNLEELANSLMLLKSKPAGSDYLVPKPYAYATEPGVLFSQRWKNTRKPTADEHDFRWGNTVRHLMDELGLDDLHRNNYGILKTNQKHPSSKMALFDVGMLNDRKVTELPEEIIKNLSREELLRLSSSASYNSWKPSDKTRSALEEALGKSAPAPWQPPKEYTQRQIFKSQESFENALREEAKDFGISEADFNDPRIRKLLEDKVSHIPKVIEKPLTPEKERRAMVERYKNVVDPLGERLRQLAAAAEQSRLKSEQYKKFRGINSEDFKKWK